MCLVLFECEFGGFVYESVQGPQRSPKALNEVVNFGQILGRNVLRDIFRPFVVPRNEDEAVVFHAFPL
jgi:hypothetical protein